MKNAEAVPLRSDELLLVRVDELGKSIVDRGAVGVLGEGAADDDQRTLRVLELLSELALACHEVCDRFRVVSEVVIAICGVDALADHAHLESGVQPGFADPRVENRRLVSWVRAHQKDRVRLLDAGDSRVEEVVGPYVNSVYWSRVATDTVEGGVVGT